MKNETAARDRQIKELTASLLLLESHLQKEKKRAQSESRENQKTISRVNIKKHEFPVFPDFFSTEYFRKRKKKHDLVFFNTLFVLIN